MSEENPDSVWEAFPGKDITTLALPDFYSNYFAYSFDRTEGDARYIGLRITGEFGYARYMSYNIYDAEEGTSFGALTDFQIAPLPNNVNPFVAGSDSDAENRSYTVNVQPAGRFSTAQGNELTFDPSEINILTVIVRYYVPQDEATGSVPLPTIEAFDVRTQKDVPLPPIYPLRGNTPKDTFSRRLAPIFKTVVDDTLRFYRGSGAGQFDNADNIYLISAVDQGVGQVLVIRITPPNYPSVNDEFDKTDVRYWSFNEGDADTSTPFGMKDEDFRPATDGFVYIAIGDDIISTKAEQGGYNFMPWKADRSQAVIVYRNLLTNPQYRGHLDKVPEVAISDLFHQQNLYTKDAKNFIGDYAPTGQKISLAQFMSDYGGFGSPGFEG
jgi:hypothetical protein